MIQPPILSESDKHKSSRNGFYCSPQIQSAFVESEIALSRSSTVFSDNRMKLDASGIGLLAVLLVAVVLVDF